VDLISKSASGCANFVGTVKFESVLERRFNIKRLVSYAGRNTACWGPHIL
jgi:hypothetical protein